MTGVRPLAGRRGVRALHRPLEPPRRGRVRRLAERPPTGSAWVDVGCGTGELSGADRRPARGRRGSSASTRRPTSWRAPVSGSPTRSRRSRSGGPMRCRSTTAAADVVVSGLVLNFVPDVPAALSEAVRVTRRGGVVAAYLWDYAGRMELIRRFWDAAVALDPAAAELDEGRRFPLGRARPPRGGLGGRRPLGRADHGDRRPDTVRRLRRLLAAVHRRHRPGARVRLPAARRNAATRSANGCAPPCRPVPRARSTSSPAPGPSAAAPDRCPGRRDHRGGRGGAGPHCPSWTSRSRPPRPSSGTAPAPTSSTPCSRSRPRSSATTALPDDTVRELKRLAIEARLHGGSLPASAGGQGWTAMEQVLVHEQLGQATGGLWSFIPGAYNALVHCTPEQRRRYLDPSLRGERNGSYAITEPGQGSDARTLASTAVRDRGHRGVRPQRREVVRHRPVGHGLHDLPLPRHRRRRAAAHAVPRRLRHARRRADRRPRLHPHVRRPPPAVHARATCACRPTRCWAGSARPTR